MNVKTGVIKDVPQPTLWRLMSLAEKRGIRVVDLLNELASVGNVSRPGDPRLVPTTQQRIAIMHARGFGASAMATELGITRQAVYYHLRRIRSRDAR